MACSLAALTSANPMAAAPGLPVSVAAIPNLPVSPLPTPPVPSVPVLPGSSASVISSAINSDLPTATPTQSLTISSVGQTLPSAIPSLPVSVPTPSVVPPTLIPNLSSAIAILQFLITLIQQTIASGGVAVPGVTGLGLGVGTNLIPFLIGVATQLLGKSGLNVPAL
ncbi:hypothetical protein MMC29_002606 [Sticta canariensis]|nr:hypothetical protein [Sticta canariensis]